MWKTPSKSLNTTNAFTTGLKSQFQTQQEDIPTCIKDNNQYMKLYQDINNCNIKAYSSLEKQQSQKKQKHIKTAISNKIKFISKTKQFENKFGSIKPSKTRKVLSNRITPIIGMTRKDSDENQLTKFFDDPEKAFDLDEKARLLQFYLRDFQSSKNNMNFVDKVQLNNRYRRLSVNSNAKKERQLFHDSRQYMNCAKTVYLKEDHLMESAVQYSRKHPGYARQKNFLRKSYILSQINQNLIVNRKVQEDPAKQRQFNLLKRLFMMWAQCSQAKRVYCQYIERQKLEKVYKFIFCEEQSQSLSQRQFLDAAQKIMQYKSRKKIQFEDFKELINTINKINKYPIITLSHIQQILNKEHKFLKNRLIYRKIDAFKSQNNPQIQKYMQKIKIRTAFKAYYDKNPNVIAKKYLPLNDLIDFFKKQAIIPKNIPMNKFMGACHWYMYRIQGYTLQQFTQIHISLALIEEQDMKSLKNYFRKIKIRQILQQ